MEFILGQYEVLVCKKKPVQVQHDEPVVMLASLQAVLGTVVLYALS